MDNGHDMLQLCRLCLVKDDVNIPIFQEHDDNSEIFVKISSCLPVKLERNDKLPQNICDSCFSKLDVVYDLWTTSSNSDKQLHKWLYEAEAANAKEKRLTKASNKSGDAIVKQEKIDDAHETVTYVEEVPWDGASSSAGPSASLTAEDEPPPKRARRAAAVKASITVAAESDDDDDDDNGPMTKMEDDSDEDDPTFGDVPSTSADDQPGPSGVGKDGSEAPGYLQQPANSSNEEDINQCYICGEIFDNDEGLRLHLENLEAFLKVYCKHCCNFVRFEESVFHLQITYSCSLCKLILPHETFLEHYCLHKPSNQLLAADRKLECERCDKIFFSDTDMSKHIEEYHNNLNLPQTQCKCCKLTFPSKEVLDTHITGHYKKAAAAQLKLAMENEKRQRENAKNNNKQVPKKSRVKPSVVTKESKKPEKVEYEVPVKNKNKVIAKHNKSTERKQFSCDTCHKIYKRKSYFDSHRCY